MVDAKKIIDGKFYNSDDDEKNALENDDDLIGPLKRNRNAL